MVACQKVCLRKLGGRRSQEVSFGRFLANRKVTVDLLIAGWSDQTRAAARGRHVLAIQDTSECKFKTTAERSRGLGEIGRGNIRGVLLHAMVGVDAQDGALLGLVAGRVWTRSGRATVPHEKRALTDKESERWIGTAEAAKQVLAPAAMITVIADRESDIYAEWALIPTDNVHIITRVSTNRCLFETGKLFDFGAALPVVATRVVELRERAGRAARQVQLSLRFGAVEVRRPGKPGEKGLPKSLCLRYVEVVELEPPADVEPLHWRLLTTHAVDDVDQAWQIVDWYRQRWIVEQLFRTMKQQGLQVEDSQIDSADRLMKLVAIAAKAACLTMQLVQARDGKDQRTADAAFTRPEIATLEALNPQLEGKTALQKNPHRKHSLAWAAWVIARLGGWDGYRSSRPPGPITFKDGLERFRAIAAGWALRDVCMP
jgi:hypothetical protein